MLRLHLVLIPVHQSMRLHWSRFVFQSEPCFCMVGDSFNIHTYRTCWTACSLGWHLWLWSDKAYYIRHIIHIIIHICSLFLEVSTKIDFSVLQGRVVRVHCKCRERTTRLLTCNSIRFRYGLWCICCYETFECDTCKTLPRCAEPCSLAWLTVVSVVIVCMESRFWAGTRKHYDKSRCRLGSVGAKLGPTVSQPVWASMALLCNFNLKLTTCITFPNPVSCDRW